MIKHKILVLIALLFAVTGFSFFVSAQETRTETKLFTEGELIKMHEAVARAEATLIHEGYLTLQLKNHSKLYKKYEYGKKLRELLSSMEDFRMERFSGCEGHMPNEPPFNLRSALQKMASDSSAVIIGTVEKKTSQLTEDEDYIFTDYEISVENVLKNNISDPIQEHSKITFTRPGGTILLGNHLVEAVDDDFLPLHKGMKYLLFMQSIPDDPGSYKALDSKSSFLIIDNKVLKLTEGRFPLTASSSMASSSSEDSSETDENSFMEEVYSAVASTKNLPNGEVK